MNYSSILKDNKWLILILALASALRFYHLDFQSAWLDEIYTLNVASPNQTFGNLISEVNLKEGFPYLYFISLKILFSIFGHTIFVARFFSAFFGVLSVFAIYKLGKELLTKEAGLFAATLLSINEYNLYISQDARPYTLYLFAVIFSFFFLSKLLKENSRKNAVFYGLSVGLVLSSNFFSFINVLSQMVIIGFYFMLTDKTKRITDLKNYMISGVIALVILLPNYNIIIKLFGFKTFWAAKPTPDSFSLLFKELLGNSEMTLFIFTPLFLCFLIHLFQQKDCYDKNSLIENKFLFSSIMFFVWIFGCILFLFIKSYGEVSLIITRYFTSIIPVLFLVLGFGLYLIKNRFVRIILITSITAFTFTNIFAVKHYYDSTSKTQFKETSDFVINNNNKNELVFTSLKYWFDYFLVTKTTKFEVYEKPSLEILITEMMNDPSKIKAFWYVDAHGRPFVLSDAAQKFVNDNFYIENNFDGFDAWGKHYILLKDVPMTIDISKFKNLKPLNGNSFQYSMETFENSNNVLKIVGWAYFENQTASKSALDILLIKDGKAIRLLTQRVNRPDVTTYFKSDFDLSNSGFSSTINTEKIEKGKYQIGVYLVNKETEKEGLIITDKIIEK